MNLKVRDKNRAKNRLNKTSATLVCKDCNRMFTINIGEICWHYDVGNIIPETCPDCRAKKKERLSQHFSKKNEKTEATEVSVNTKTDSIEETEERLIEEI